MSHFQILLRELGSDEAVSEAVKGNGGQWRGRAEKISELEAEIVRLKKMSEGVEQNRSNKMFDSQLSSPEEVGQLQARDSGDGSSGQESLSRQDDNDASTTSTTTSAMFLATLKSTTATPTLPSINVRELQSKVHEYKIICQVFSIGLVCHWPVLVGLIDNIKPLF